MGQLLKPLVPKEAGRSLDGMHGTEDPRQEGVIAGARLKLGKTTLHAVQSFLTFNQELPCQFVHRISLAGAGTRTILNVGYRRNWAQT